MVEESVEASWVMVRYAADSLPCCYLQPYISAPRIVPLASAESVAMWP